MGILDIFRNPAQPVQPAQPAQPAPAPPGNIPNPTTPTAQPPGAEPNGVVPDNINAQTNVPTEPQTPLDKFNDLWEAKPTDPNAPGAAAPEPELTAESLQKAMADANFASGVSPEHLTAISQGGEAAQTAFAEAMNAVARQVMVQSTLINNKLTTKAVETATADATAGIPELVRKQAAQNHLKDTNPVFTNPAIKPFIEAAQQQLLVKNPTATPAELTSMTNDLMVAMSETFAPAAPVDPSAPVQEDWSKFIPNIN